MIKKSCLILGSGQLAQMLAEASKKINLHTIVIDKNTIGCAKKTADECYTIPSLDDQRLEEILTRADVATFESEFFEISRLRTLPPNEQKKFHPSLEAIELLQDKWEQKKILTQLNIPTARYSPQITAQNIVAAIDILIAVLHEWQKPLVLKWSKLGYDGHGVRFLKTIDDIHQAQTFIVEGIKKGGCVFAEECIAFEYEAAALIANQETNLSLKLFRKMEFVNPSCWRKIYLVPIKLETF